MSKESIIQEFDYLAGIVEENSLSKDLLDRINDVRKDISDYRVRIPVIGRFSAGKSAMLNTLMGKEEILPEDQSPKTAVATELIYDEVEKVNFIRPDGKNHICSLGDAERVDVTQYAYCEYHLKRAYLLQHSDMVFVDMPGFDSGLERHNKAILQYVDKASAYILVIDVEDGAMSQATIDFVRNVNKYGADLAIVLTMCDKKSQDEVEKIKANISATAAMIYGRSLEIVTTDINDENLPNKMDNVLKALDFDRSFDTRYSAIYKELKAQIVEVLKEIKEDLHYNPYQLDKRCLDLEKEKERLDDQLRAKRSELHNHFFGEVLNEVSMEVRHVLQGSINRLVNAAMSGDNVFASTISDIVRPVIVVNLRKKIDFTVKNFVNSLDFQSDGIVDVEEITRNLKGIYDNVSSVLQKYKKEDGKGVNSPKSISPFAKTNATSTVQGILAVLAMATDVVAPEVEILLIFLPQLVPMINGWMKTYQMNQLKGKMQDDIIPEIIITLENNLKEVLVAVEEEEFCGVKSVLDNQINAKTEAIVELKAKNEEEKNKIQEKLVVLEEHIKNLA